MVKYNPKLMDKRTLTRFIDRGDGISVAQGDLEQLNSVPVSYKMGSLAARIELLAYRTSLDVEKRTGEVPINVSLFPENEFTHAVKAMRPTFIAGLCVSDLVQVASEGEQLGDMIVPEGKIGLATISSITISGVMLKAGIPLDFRFGGTLQVRDHKPLRFTELIEYTSCSLYPAQLFIASKMTNVSNASINGDGKILASFREIVGPSKLAVEIILGRLRAAGIYSPVIMGGMSEPICEIPVGLNKIGMIFLSGINPAAAATEAGIGVSNHALSGLIDFQRLKSVWDL